MIPLFSLEIQTIQEEIKNEKTAAKISERILSGKISSATLRALLNEELIENVTID
jgi:hypothetical protein